MSSDVSDPFSIGVRTLVDATIVDIRGSLDIATSPELQNAIESAETEQAWHIIVSFEDCCYCDSTGLSILARAKKRLSDRLLVVVPKESPVRHVFDVTHVAEYLALFESVEEARHVSTKSTTLAEAKQGTPES